MALKDWFTHCQKTTAGTVLQREWTKRMPKGHQRYMACACGQACQGDSQDASGVTQGKLRHYNKAMSQWQSWEMTPGVLAAVGLWVTHKGAQPCGALSYGWETQLLVGRQPPCWVEISLCQWEWKGGGTQVKKWLWG